MMVVDSAAHHLLLHCLLAVDQLQEQEQEHARRVSKA